jgi:flagellar hook-associated protein 1 FlgK
MSLMTALNAATSGLRGTQAGIDVVAQNIANADSAGYTRRRAVPVQALAGDRTSGVRSGAIERVLDLVAQRQMRAETSGSAYTSLNARYANELDRLFGPPGGVNSLDGSLNRLSQALQGLASDPSSYSTRSAVLDAGAVLSGRIASIAEGVQGLRTEAEGRIGSAVARANELLTSIAAINAKAVRPAPLGDNVALLDERDRLINELSQLVDIQTFPGPNGSVSLSTTGGLMLFNGTTATRLSFDGRAQLDANAQYSTNGDERGVGTITATSSPGGTIDVVGNQMIRSGEIAAALELRDRTLVQAQRQLDELAAGMARALSDRPAPVTPATSGGFSGYTIDLAGLQPGNTVTLDYMVGGSARRILLVPTNGTAPDPIPAADTADPNALVVRVPVSAPIDGGEATAIQTALTNAGVAISVDSPANGQLRFLNSAGRDERFRRLGRDHGDDADERRAAAAVLRRSRPRQPALHRLLRGRVAPHRLRPASRHQPGASGRSLSARGPNTSPPTLQGDATRPQHLLDSLTKAKPRLFGRERHRRRQRALFFERPRFRPAHRRDAGRQRRGRGAARRGPAGGARRRPGPLRGFFGRQYRSGNGAARLPSDRLRGECPRHDRRARHARHADADLSEGETMAITPYAAPFAAGSASARRSGEQFVAIRRDLDALQRQFATGLKSETYGGLGLERRTSLDVRGKLSAIAGYGDAIKGAELRLTLMTQGIERLASGARDTKATLFPLKFDAGLDGRTTAQKSAEQRLSLAIDVLNTEVDGRYLFGGRAQDAAPVESMARILDGDPATGRKGLRHLIAERKSADQGADNLGRLAMPAPGSPSEVRLTEDPNASLRQNFGFRILGAEGSAGAITLASTPAANPAATLTFGAVPQDGDAVRVFVNGPDGRQSTVDLTARTTPNPANAGSEFQIGADAATSAANLVAALPPGSTIAGVQSKPGAGALTLAFPGGAAASHTFEVTAPPAPGASISVTLGLRDGSQRTITLTARATADPASATEFAIGGDERRHGRKPLGCAASRDPGRIAIIARRDLGRDDI